MSAEQALLAGIYQELRAAKRRESDTLAFQAIAGVQDQIEAADARHQADQYAQAEQLIRRAFERYCVAPQHQEAVQAAALEQLMSGDVTATSLDWAAAVEQGRFNAHEQQMGQIWHAIAEVERDAGHALTSAERRQIGEAVAEAQRFEPELNIEHAATLAHGMLPAPDHSTSEARTARATALYTDQVEHVRAESGAERPEVEHIRDLGDDARADRVANAIAQYRGEAA